MSRAPRIKKLRQWQRIVMMRHGNYAVIYTDEFGQVVAFDTHGHLLESRLAAPPQRELRLEAILHKRTMED